MARDLPSRDDEGGPGAGPPRPRRRRRDPRHARGPPAPAVRPGLARADRGDRASDRARDAAVGSGRRSAEVVGRGSTARRAPPPHRPVRRAAQPAARDGRGPEPPRPDRPPPARPARRAGADLRPARSRPRCPRCWPGGWSATSPSGSSPTRSHRPEAVRDGALRGRRVVRADRPADRARSPGTRRVVALVGPTGRGQDDDRGQARGQLQARARPPRRAWSRSTPTGSRPSSSCGLCRDHRPAAGRGQRPRARCAGRSTSWATSTWC